MRIRIQFVKNVNGQTLVELLLVIGLLSIILPALITGFTTSRSGKVQQQQRLQATALLKETSEAIRNVREKGWTSFAVNGTYHPTLSSSAWNLTSGSDTVNGFTRQIVISDVNRNAAGTIVTSGGTLDPSTKAVTITISWTQPYSSSITSSYYLTRYLDNAAYIQTTQADFNTGTLGNVEVTNSSGGEVTLSHNNKAKWCSPAFSPATIDLPDGPPVAVAATGAALITIPNDVFVATAPTATNSIKLAYVNVAANVDPPTTNLRGTFTLDASKYSAPGLVPSGIGIDNNFKTNDVKYYKSPSGKVYALLATDLPDHEVVAIQVNDGSGDAYQDPTNKIYKYWTFFNTKIYGTAFNSPTANSAETTNAGDNNGFQTTPTNAYVNDATFAVDTNSGSNTGTLCTGTDKDKHRYYNYGFNIPSGATINGVEVNLAARVDNTTGAPQMCVQLSWDGGTTWTAAKSTSTLTTTEATYTLGGAADTWGAVMELY